MLGAPWAGLKPALNRLAKVEVGRHSGSERNIGKSDLEARKQFFQSAQTLQLARAVEPIACRGPVGGDQTSPFDVPEHPW